MEPIMSENKKLIYTLIAFSASVVVGLVGLLNWFLLREFIMKMLQISSINKLVWRSIDSFSFLFFGIVWLAFVLYCQHLFKKRIEKKKLLETLCKVIGGQLLLLFITQIVPLLFTSNELNQTTWLILIAQLVLGILFIGITRIKLLFMQRSK